jgi:hypothetical protein
MTTFDEREEAFERLFAHDEELRFKATARCDRLIGLWAAGKLGKTGDEADAYARDVVRADFKEAGHGDVVRKIQNDFAAAGIVESDGEIERTLLGLMERAIAEVKAG